MIVLRRAIVTEKSLKLAGLSQYTFEVDKQANKPQIAKAVAEQFKVDVLSVKTIITKGERKTQRRSGKPYLTKGFKKAMVQLKIGQKIALFEAVPEEKAVITTGDEPIIKDKKDILGRTKVRIEKGATGASPTTQRKVITGK